MSRAGSAAAIPVRREDPVAIRERDDGTRLATDVAVRERQLQDDRNGLLGCEVPDRHECPVPVDGGLVRADRFDPDVVAGRDFERHVARHELQRLTDFGRDGIADLRRVGDVVEVSAAGIRELLEEPLIEVVADAERRCRDPSCPQFGGMRGEHGRVGLADIGKTVCQEETPIDTVLELVTGQLLAAAKPPFGQIGAAPGVDRAQAIDAARRDSADACVDSMTVSTTSS